MSIGGLALFKRMFSVSFLVYSCFIQLIMSFNTSGLVVSSIVTYSEGWPVVACWNRWLRPGYSLISVFLWRGRDLVRRGKVLSDGTVVGDEPLKEGTGEGDLNRGEAGGERGWNLGGCGSYQKKQVYISMHL